MIQVRHPAVARCRPAPEYHLRCPRSDLERLGAGFRVDGPGAVLAEVGCRPRGSAGRRLPVGDVHQERERGAHRLARRVRPMAEVAVFQG